MFPGAFFVGFGEGGAHAEELSEDGAHGHGLVAGLGRRSAGSSAIDSENLKSVDRSLMGLNSVVLVRFIMTC